MDKTQKTILSDNNTEDLLCCLSKIDISVPGRTEGRTPEHRELYSICRLLSTLANTQYLSYPVSLKKRESPDFRLCCSDQQIGIEVTEATHSDYSEYLTRSKTHTSKAELNSKILCPPTFQYGKKLTKKQKNDFHTSNELDDGWVGDKPEKEWLLYIKEAIEKKNKKLKHPNFEKFEQNWLLIYVNTPTSILEKELLKPYIEDLQRTCDSQDFDKIFIETGWTEEDSETSKPFIIAYSRASKNPECIPLNNVWKYSSFT